MSLIPPTTDEYNDYMIYISGHDGVPARLPARREAHIQTMTKAKESFYGSQSPYSIHSASTFGKYSDAGSISDDSSVFSDIQPTVDPVEELDDEDLNLLLEELELDEDGNSNVVFAVDQIVSMVSVSGLQLKLIEVDC